MVQELDDICVDTPNAARLCVVVARVGHVPSAADMLQVRRYGCAPRGRGSKRQRCEAARGGAGRTQAKVSDSTESLVA